MPVTVDKLLGRPLLHTHQIGDIIIGTTGSVNVANIVTVTTNKNADAETIILVDATSGAITITLPAALGYINKVYTIKKIDSSKNSVIVDGNGTETIDNNQTVTIGFQYTALQIVSNGLAWYII
jgi:hypothetical protein